MNSYQQAMCEEFGTRHDHFRLIGEDNCRRYLPVKELRDPTPPRRYLLRHPGARVCGPRGRVSHHGQQALGTCNRRSFEALEDATESWAGSIEFVEESDDALADVIRLQHTDRLRYAAPDRVPPVIREAVTEHCIYIADAPVLMHGRVELMWYVREQSVCVDYHRYGNLGLRSDEEREEPL